MAIAFRSQSNVIGTSTTLTGTEPSGAAAGDIIICLFIATNGGSPVPPAGLTIITNATSTGNAFDYMLGYLVRGGSAPNLTWTYSGNRYRELHVLAFSGCDTGYAIDNFAQTASDTGTNPDAPAVTAISNAAMALAIGINWSGTASWGAPTGYTTRTVGSGGADDGTIATKLLSGAGSEDPDAFTGAGSSDARWSATLTLAPIASPHVTTLMPTDITATTATGNGNVVSDAGDTITERGVCWSTSPDPTTSSNKATAAGTTGAFTADITGLSANTTYYVRAYAINSIGTDYGINVNFTYTEARSAWIQQ